MRGKKHFGRAARLYVSQPTLSVAIKKLEEELDVKLFERSAGEVSVTSLGEEIVRQAQSVLEQANEIKEIAKRGGPSVRCADSVIYTIGPYLLPELVRNSIKMTPQMPLMLQENFTVRLLEMLRTGEIDCAIMAEPFPDTGLALALCTTSLYGRGAQRPSAGGEKPVHHGPQERDHVAVGRGPLLPRPCAGGLPRIRALCQQFRRHSPHV